MLESYHNVQKQNILHFFPAKNKPVESTDHEVGLPDATSTEVSSQNTNEGSGSKAEKCKFQDVWKSEFLWLIIYDYSSDIMSCDVCRKAGPDIAGKTEFVTGKKKFKRESLVYHNKSQKHKKMFQYGQRKKFVGFP
jgi:hypothetical protein